MADVQTKARRLFAGAVALGALAVLAWYQWSATRYATYRLETHDAVSGLIVDSPVEFHGVEVGKVAKVELVDPGTVRILLRIAKQAPISKATVAAITTRGLAARGFMGYVYVALEDAGADRGPLPSETGPPYPMIASAASRTAAMDTTVAEAAEQLRQLARPLQALLNQQTIASLQRSLDSLQQVAAILVAHEGRLDSLIVNAERASRELRPLLDSSQATLQQLRTQVLPQVDRTTSDLQALSRALTGTANRLARDPATLLRGTATPPGPGER